MIQKNDEFALNGKALYLAISKDSLGNISTDYYFFFFYLFLKRWDLSYDYVAGKQVPFGTSVSG